MAIDDVADWTRGNIFMSNENPPVAQRSYFLLYIYLHLHIHHSLTSYFHSFIKSENLKHMYKQPMGGGKQESWNSSSMGSDGSSSSNNNSKCSLCEKSMHEEIDCPWIYTRCKMVPCNGIRKLQKARTEVNYGKKFFSCTICSYYEWFEEASNEATAMKIVLPSRHSCSACGDKSHKLANCSWDNVPCMRKKCKGSMKLNICKKEHNQDIAFLTCHCGEFSWVSDAVSNAAKAKVKSSALQMEELCKQIHKIQM